MSAFLLWCQWPAMLLGLVGAPWVTGTTNRARFWGFALWVASDVFWIAYAYQIASIPMGISFAYFTFTSARGIWNNR